MNFIKRLAERIGDFFKRKKTEKKGTITPKTTYLDTLNEFLAEQSKRKIFYMKKQNTKNIWYGEVSSMHQAYILLVSLPDVLPCNITLRYSADDLFYNVKVHDTYDLELTNRCIRKRSCATIALREENKTLFQIKLSIRTDI